MFFVPKLNFYILFRASEGVANKGVARGEWPPCSNKNKDLSNYDKCLPLRDCFLAFCVGQSYDGAAAKTSERSGVKRVWHISVAWHH